MHLWSGAPGEGTIGNFSKESSGMLNCIPVSAGLTDRATSRHSCESRNPGVGARKHCPNLSEKLRRLDLMADHECVTPGVPPWSEASLPRHRCQPCLGRAGLTFAPGMFRNLRASLLPFCSQGGPARAWVGQHRFKARQDGPAVLPEGGETAPGPWVCRL